MVLDADGSFWTPVTEEDKYQPSGMFSTILTAFHRGYTTEFCLREVEKIRNQTRDVLFTFNDSDLERMISFERRGKKTEHSLRWILHHLIDHEAQHKGQILMLKRLMV